MTLMQDYSQSKYHPINTVHRLRIKWRDIFGQGSEFFIEQYKIYGGEK